MGTAFCICGPEGIRTPDPLHAMQVRYQLRHGPIGFPEEPRLLYYRFGALPFTSQLPLVSRRTNP